MPVRDHWCCPYYRGELVSHRFPPDWDVDLACFDSPAVKAFAAQEGIAHAVYHQRPSKGLAAAWQRGPVFWAWECQAATPQGRCGWKVWWEDDRCHNPACAGLRARDARPHRLGASRGPQLFLEPPTPFDALEDLEEQRAKKKAGKKHRPVDGCPQGCPGPHDFMLVTSAERLATLELDEALEVRATVIPPVKSAPGSVLDPSGAQVPLFDPTGGLGRGKLRWKVAKGPGEFDDTRAQARESAGDEPRALARATAAGDVVVECTFEFGRTRAGEPERFPTAEQRAKGVGSDTVTLTFGRADPWSRYLELALKAPMVGSEAFMLREYGQTYLKGQDFVDQMDGKVERFVEEAKAAKKAKRSPELANDRTIEVQNRLIDAASAAAGRVLAFRARVREAPQRLARHAEHVLGLEGKTGCWAQNALPLVKRAVAQVYASTSTSRRRVDGASVKALVPSTADRTRSGYLPPGAVPRWDGAQHVVKAGEVHNGSSDDEIAGLLVFPALPLARAVLYGHDQRFHEGLEDVERDVEATMTRIADELLDFAEGEGYEGVSVPAHRALKFMLAASGNERAVYRAWFGKGGVPVPAAWNLWDQAFGFDKLVWYDKDPEQRARDELGPRRKRVRAVLEAIELPAKPLGGLVGLMPHELVGTKTKEVHASKDDPFAAWAEAYA